MSDVIGPIHIKERPSSEMQSRVDAEVCVWYLGFSVFAIMYRYLLRVVN